MFRKLLRCVGEYKTPTALTLFFIVLEAVIDCVIPFITGDLVNHIQSGEGGMDYVWRSGAILVALALLSLAFGAVAAHTAAKASTGFARNLRREMFYRVQGYAFENIDKFSAASLVTRMTTDVSYAQMSYMMLIRIAVRAPLMLIFSIVMAYLMGGALATSFVVLVPVLAFGLILISRKAMPAFRRVFKKYDRGGRARHARGQGLRPRGV